METNNTLATATANNNNTTKVNNLLAVVASEATSISAIVAALYETRNNASVSEFAAALFADVTEETSRKVALKAGYKRYINFFPVLLTLESGKKVCGSRKTVAKGLYSYVELSFLDGLRAAAEYYFAGKNTQILATEGAYYDKRGNIVDAAEAEKILKEKAEKAEQKKAEKENANATETIFASADILILLNSALQKAGEATELGLAIKAAIKLI